MRKRYFNPTDDGFYGVFHPHRTNTKCVAIMMMGDSAEDYMAKTWAQWLHRHGMAVLAMAASRKDVGHHNYPIESFGRALSFLKDRGFTKFAIFGGATTAMLALVAASYYPEFTLTVAFAPTDFILEGYYRDDKDGAKERPGNGESTVTVNGKALPYLPYAYRHPEYWQNLEREAKETGNKMASRIMIDKSEQRYPVTEKEKIKVENIQGKVILIGAEDDCMWDTSKYIRRMYDRYLELNGPGECLAYIYQHGTHYIYPESLMKMLFPVGDNYVIGKVFKEARDHTDACMDTRIDLDMKLKKILYDWTNE